MPNALIMPPLRAPTKPALRAATLSKGGGWWLAGASLDLDFVNQRAFNRLTAYNGKPEGLLTVSRASGAGRWGSDGVYVWDSTSGTLRYDYDPVTLLPIGVLIEEQRTNLLLRSAELNNASWAGSNITVTADAAVAPDGSTSMDLLTRGSTSAAYRGQAITKAASALQYTYTVFGKKSVGNYLSLTVQGSGGSSQRASAVFNLATGAVANSGGLGAFSVDATSITAVGGGIYRCGLTFTTDATAGLNCYASPNSNGVLAVDGTDSAANSAVYLWGAQLEAGAFATSYIPTVASQVTRAADSITLATSAFGYNATESTLFVDFDAPLGIAQDIVWIANGLAESLAVYVNSATGALMWCRDNSVTQVAQTLQTGRSARAKVACRFKQDDFAGSLNGLAVATDTTATMPTPTQLMLNPRSVVSASGEQHIRRLAYWDAGKSDAELQRLAA